MAKFENSIDYVLAHEGGYVDHPCDPGGMTQWGISLRYLKAIGHDVDGDGDVDGNDIAVLTREQAKEIYHEMWKKAKVGKLDSQIIATKVFDMIVNMGARAGTKRLQKALKTLGAEIRADGRLGPKTLAAANDAEADALLEAIRLEQARFYKVLVAKNEDLACFLDGWLVRAAA